MATLQKIVIQDFRNIQLQELTFSPNINCISGGNGEGKTNLLDAIWYLSMTKSAFSTSDRFNFRHGTSAFALSGTYAMPGGSTSRFSIRVQDGGQTAAPPPASASACRTAARRACGATTSPTGASRSTSAYCRS